jgi:hypothetical protein
MDLGRMTSCPSPTPCCMLCPLCKCVVELNRYRSSSSNSVFGLNSDLYSYFTTLSFILNANKLKDGVLDAGSIRKNAKINGTKRFCQKYKKDIFCTY